MRIDKSISPQNLLTPGCHNPLEPWSRAARKWRGNEEMKRKWRGDGDRMRKWTENEEMDRE